MDQGRRRRCRRRRRKELQTKTNQEQEDSLSFEQVAAAAAFTLSSSLCLFGCWIVPFRVEAVVFCSTKEREEDEEELHYFTWNNRTCEGWEGLSAGIASPPPPPFTFCRGVQCGGKRDESKKKKSTKVRKGMDAWRGKERKGKKERKKWEEEVLLCCLLATGGACWRTERLFCVFFCCVGVASSQLTWYSQIIYKNPPCNHPLPSSLLLVALLDEHPSSHPEMHY